ncbi:hypothetical protein [Nannocystis sp. SCPEA4]|uniref:hypothetical protein n=1 Tax=Nannocystis sp. SCPEA4 TaxID=2996787 RepID=UPI00227142EF|nr:hypothetical protein [Nannocystis sp. SCPEA4]MCY1062147.1 hypothetical protein [Nannocystis sp. SCPEA4]
MSKVVLPKNVRHFNILEELANAIACLRTGLGRIAEGHAVHSADAPTLFLLSNGIERYLKVGIHVLVHDQTGDFAAFALMQKNYSHNLLKLETAVFDLETPNARANMQSRDDRDFVKTDPLLRKLVECLDGFARTERYFLLDGVSGEPVDPNISPSERWLDVRDAAAGDPSLFLEPARARQVVSGRLIGRVQQYLRCISQAVIDSTSGSRYLAAGMGVFHDIKDRDLERPVESR